MNRDQLTIVEPNGVRRTKPLPAQGLTIGRGSENDLVIAYELASRQHARITFDGARYYIMDLNSANGTYLDNIRLAPNTPTAWPPNKILRIAGVSIQLERTQVHRRPEELDDMETRIGWLPEELEPQQSRQTNRMSLVLALALILLCLCAAVSVGVYYFIYPAWP